MIAFRARGHWGANVLLLLASLVARQLLLCRGHGFLMSPLSRARLLGFGEYEASAGNGLGARPFRTNPDGTPLNDQPDVCGDPHQDTGDMSLRSRPTAIQATYSAGSTISVTFRARVNHGGWIGFKLCTATRTDPQQSCFDQYPLVNADTGYTRWWFQTGIYGTETDYVTRWRLPAGVSCDGGCILQVTYRTANSCVDSCSAAECGSSYSVRNNPVTGQTNLVACGRTEVFRDCADIRITPSGGTTTPPPPPVSSPPRQSPPSPSPPRQSPPSPAPSPPRRSPPSPSPPQRSPPSPRQRSPPSPPQRSPPSPSPPGGSTCGQSAASFCSGKAQGMYGDRCVGCTKYFWCYDTGSAYMSCAAGTAMDPSGTKSTCDFIGSFTC